MIFFIMMELLTFGSKLLATHRSAKSSKPKIKANQRSLRSQIQNIHGDGDDMDDEFLECLVRETSTVRMTHKKKNQKSHLIFSG